MYFDHFLLSGTIPTTHSEKKIILFDTIMRILKLGNNITTTTAAAAIVTASVS